MTRSGRGLRAVVMALLVAAAPPACFGAFDPPPDGRVCEFRGRDADCGRCLRARCQ